MTRLRGGGFCAGAKLTKPQQDYVAVTADTVSDPGGRMQRNHADIDRRLWDAAYELRTNPDVPAGAL